MRRFFGDRRGNVAIIFALTLIPITLVVGVSVDLSRMRVERTKLQSAVDAASLAAANLPTGTPDRVIRSTVEEFLSANFEGISTIDEITITRTGSAVAVAADADVPMVFSGLTGFDTRTVGAIAEATRSFSYFEVVMVLDNSGSMQGSHKIGALRTAANSLVNTLSEAETEDGSVKIGLVPFTIAVNVGTGYAGADWMDYDALSPEHTAQFGGADVNRFDLFEQLGVDWAGCVDTRAHDLDVIDTAATRASPSTLIVPYFAPDEPDTQGTDWRGRRYDIYPNNYLDDWDDDLEGAGGHEGWSCSRWIIGWWCSHPTMGTQWSGSDISGRDADPGEAGVEEPWWTDNDTSNPAKIARQQYTPKYALDPDLSGGKGPNYNCNVQPLMPLTSDFDALEDAIDDMDADGYTNITQGTMWGWRLLSPQAPFTEGANYDDADTRKFLIVLTDGENNVPDQTGPNHNKSIYSPYEYAVDGRLGNVNNHNQIVSEMDDRLEEICENVKDEGITVYTIAFAINDDDLEDMMEGCATDAGRYFDSPDAASLQATFEAIVNDITQLRLSR